MRPDVVSSYERLLALRELLALPDSPEMPRRSHRVTQPGDPQRAERYAGLAVAYQAHRIVDKEQGQ